MPILLSLTLPNTTAADLLVGYGAGAVIKVQRDTTSAFAAPTTVTSIALVTATEAYSYWDVNGTVSSWYRTRYENSGGTVTSDWSTAFQPDASRLYANPANVKARAGIPDATDDELVTSICNAANAYIENYTGRILAPLTSSDATYLFDGDGRPMLRISLGVISITTLEIAYYTGGGFTTLAATDYFLLPRAHERPQAWPATQVWLSNIPNSGFLAFPIGFGNVRLTGRLGFPAIPDDVAEVAEIIAVRAYKARAGGQGEQVGADEMGRPIISRFVSARDRETLDSYSLQRYG